MKNEFVKIIKSFFIFISIYLLTISLAEFILVDKYFIIYSIDWKIKLFYFIFLVLFFSILDSTGFIKKIKLRYLYLVFVFILSLSIYQIHYANHNRIITTPFIKSVNYKKVIQGDLIEIRGRGFGEIWSERKIYVGEIQLIAKKWEDDLIIAEIPVPPKYFKARLYIDDSGKLVSNFVEIEILDPTPVLMGEINIR